MVEVFLREIRDIFFKCYPCQHYEALFSDKNNEILLGCILVKINQSKYQKES